MTDIKHGMAIATDSLQQNAINQIDAHVDTATKEATDDGSIAKIYLVARPILLFLEGVLFFKPTWHNAFKMLVGALDAEYLPQVDEGGAGGDQGNATPKRTRKAK